MIWLSVACVFQGLTDMTIRENVQSSRRGQSLRKDHLIKGKIVNKLFKQEQS